MTSRKRKSENDDDHDEDERKRIKRARTFDFESDQDQDQDQEMKQEITPSPKTEAKIDLVELERLERALIGLSYFKSKQKVETLIFGLCAYLRLVNWAVDRGQLASTVAFNRARIITSRVAFAGLSGFTPENVLQSDQFYSFVMEPLRVLRDKAHDRGVQSMDIELDELVKKFGTLETKEKEKKNRRDRDQEPILFPLAIEEIKKTRISWWNDENVEASDSNFSIKNVALGSSLENIKNIIPIYNAIDQAGLALQYRFEPKLFENRQIAINYAVALGRLSTNGPFENATDVADAIDLLSLEITRKNNASGTINVPYL